MPKRGDVIDPETAELIKNVLLPPHDWDTRPVLWPAYKVDDIVTKLRDDAERVAQKDCQRNLAHFVCLDSIVRLLIVRVRRDGNGLFLLAVDDLLVPYEFSAKSAPVTVITRLLMGSEEALRSCLTISRDNRKVIESGGIQMFTPEQYPERSSEERSAVAMASVLEYYAFSPYTTYKQRPTLRQAMSGGRNQSPRDLAAIEVVHLRTPKKREDSEPTGRKINIRYDVTEHLRRQPTRNGYKLITIAAHERGPLGAPKKPKRRKVYKVVN